MVTHVAIDNVLERLKQRRLIEQFNIFPIRVGSEGAISYDVQEYRLGKIDREGNVTQGGRFQREQEGSLIQTYGLYSHDVEDEEEDDVSPSNGNASLQDGMNLDFFINIANLACGTTIGILQYPRFKLIDNETLPKKRKRIKNAFYDTRI